MGYTFQHIQTLAFNIAKEVLNSIIQPEIIIQLSLVLLCVGIGLVAGVAVKNVFRNKIKIPDKTYPIVKKLLEVTLKQAPLIFVVILIFICQTAMQQLKHPALILSFVGILIFTRVLIKIIKFLFFSEFWGKVFAIITWTLVVLILFNLLGPMSSLLDQIGFKIGKIHITALSIFKAFLVCSVLLFLGNYLSKLLEQKLDNIPELTGSTAVLLVKTAKVSIYSIIVLVALHSSGIELTTLAVFGGALGVGLGFGLQKVVSNFISGIILLLDKSIKPGDVIEIGDVYGYISKLQSRYVSVVIRDGSEHLIPNEDLITQKVINWSFSNTRIRLNVPIGVSYNCDPRIVIKLILSSLKNIPRILSDPTPICLLKGFGDSSVDFELRIWIKDPENGVNNIISDVLLNVWDVFKENDIVIPFPQRDVHLK
ncbi:MAG: mechanosensitive ion channel [Desulfobacterales bacterium]|nr:mechanosensitive ion channel [Desulfobacterales bacterium]